MKKSKENEVKNEQFCSLYVEADSDDEFAHEYLMYPDEQHVAATRILKRIKKKNRTVALENKEDDKHNEDNDKDNDSDESNEEKEEDELEYRIQHVLDSRKLSAEDWREMCGGMDTREITRGSVLKQPDEEFFDTAKELIEKFQIKWVHSSYLHVSWETEKDLLELCGVSAKSHIKRFRKLTVDLFEDLRPGESFPPQFLHVERIVDVDDDTIDPLIVDWLNAKLPLHSNAKINFCNERNTKIVDSLVDHNPNPGTLEDADEQDTSRESNYIESPINNNNNNYNNEEKDDDSNTISVQSDDTQSFRNHKARKAKRSDRKRDIKHNYLHGHNCWLSVKWIGQGYSDISLERIEDLIHAGVDYESQLREFYRREQQAPGIGSRGKVVRSLIKMAPVLEAPLAPAFPAGTLRDYQWEGVRWLLFNWSQKRNSILADEMGLGKTVQTAAYLQMLKRYQNLRGPFLIVAPLSTIVNWQREIAAWTDMDVILYHGSNQDRELIRKLEFSYVSGKWKKSDGVKAEVVITSPETCMSIARKTGGGRKELATIDWEVIVVDEAHKLKNYDSKISQTLREEYSYRNSLLLTGTPLQNSTDELWTLLNFVDREAFNDRESFVMEFGSVKSTIQLEALHARLKPYLLRRDKDHVEKTVPPKEELIVEVELTVPQKQYYRAIYEQNTRFLFRGEAKDGPRLCNLAMELRKCCNHPFLIKGAEKVLAEHFVNDSPLEIMIKASGKMSLLDKLLPKLQTDGHRVLIFSQFRIMLDIIEDYMALRGFSYERVDGAVTGKKRQAAIDRYSDKTVASTDNIFAMLLSTRAGGVGINLTAADTVIIFDSDWNPQNDLQAQARAHRIGQTKPVKVYRLLMRKSYEMVMFKAASLKLGLDYAVMHNLHDAASAQEQLRDLKQDLEEVNDPDMNKGTKVKKSGGRRSSKVKKELEGISLERADHYSSLSKKELENLLKHGAYDIFREERDGVSGEESAKFYESDIDHILQRSAVVVHDDRGNSTIAKTSACFSKASFVSSLTTSGAEDNIALDDPDFWTKVVGLASKEAEDPSSRMGRKKRKCTKEIVSYKEPGMSIREISTEDSPNTDNNNEENDYLDDDGKKKRIPEPVEWTESNIQKMTSAMVTRGYGDWEAISHESKLYWGPADISRGCRLGLIQLIKTASILSKVIPEQNSTDENLAPDENVNENKPPENAQSYSIYEFLDQKYFSSYIAKHRAVLLAFASEELLNSTISSENTENEEMVLEEVVMKKMFMANQGGSVETFDNLETVYRTFDQSCWQTILSQALKDSTENVVSIERNDLDERRQVFQFLLNRLKAVKMPVSIIAVSDIEKISRMRASARVKLLQIEDLFEMHIASRICDRLGSTLLHSMFTGKSPHVGWTEIDDVNLIKAVNEIGLPEGKRRVQSITKILEGCSVCSPDDPKQMFENSEMDVEAGVNSSETEQSIQVNLDKVNGNNSETCTNNLDQQEHISNLQILPTRDTKYLMKRTKFITQILREIGRPKVEESSDMKKAEAEKAAMIAVAIKADKMFADSIIKALYRIGRPRTTYESIVHDWISPIHIGSQSVVADNTIQPQDYLLNWNTFMEEMKIDPKDEIGRRKVKDAVLEICKIADDLYNKTITQVDQKAIPEVKNSKAVTEGLFTKVTYRTIEGCMERCQELHQARMLLCHLREDNYFHLRAAIRRGCKGAGPNCSKGKRDQALPPWWTAHHDINLLKAVVSKASLTNVLQTKSQALVDNSVCEEQELTSPVDGMHDLDISTSAAKKEKEKERDFSWVDWKCVIEDNRISQPPPNFVMPNNSTGVEWTTVLTPKVAEKRFQAILLASNDLYNLLPQCPSSPDVISRKQGQNVNKKGSNTLVSSFGIRSSWIPNSFPVSKPITAVEIGCDDIEIIETPLSGSFKNDNDPISIVKAIPEITSSKNEANLEFETFEIIPVTEIELIHVVDQSKVISDSCEPVSILPEEMPKDLDKTHVTLKSEPVKTATSIKSGGKGGKTLNQELGDYFELFQKVIDFEYVSPAIVTSSFNRMTLLVLFLVRVSKSSQ